MVRGSHGDVSRIVPVPSAGPIRSLVSVARSAASAGDDGVEVFFGEAQVFADEGAGDEALAGFAAEPGFAGGQSLGRSCWFVKEPTRFVGGRGLPRWLGPYGVGWRRRSSSVCKAASKCATGCRRCWLRSAVTEER